MKQRAKLDAITLAVLRSGLINAVAEMKAVVVRTAYSNLWKEAGDLSCGLLTNRGELAVQGIGDIPIHLASMPMSLGACLVRISADAETGRRALSKRSLSGEQPSA